MQGMINIASGSIETLLTIIRSIDLLSGISCVDLKTLGVGIINTSIIM